MSVSLLGVTYGFEKISESKKCLYKIDVFMAETVFICAIKPGFEIRPLLGMNQQTLLAEIEFFHILLSFFQKNLYDDITVTIEI